PECFDDRALRNDIFPTLGPIRGTCSYCGTQKVFLLEPTALGEYFELLVNVYEPDSKGKSLVEWMKEDWHLFKHAQMDVAHVKKLLGDILDDRKIIRKRFSPSSTYKSEGL